MSNKTNNLKAYLRDLYEGIVSKKPDASRNPQNFRSEIEAIRTGGELYEVMDASELPNDAPDGSLALVEGEPIPEAYTVSSIDELPSNAVDGSMAIVESDSIEGTWFLNRHLSQPSLTDMYFEFETFDPITGERLYKDKTHYDESGDGWEFYYCNEDICSFVYSEDSEEFYWEGVLWRYIRINTQIPDETDAWIRANGRKLSSLYTRENGEWVYKCEVV